MSKESGYTGQCGFMRKDRAYLHLKIFNLFTTSWIVFTNNLFFPFSNRTSPAWPYMFCSHLRNNSKHDVWHEPSWFITLPSAYLAAIFLISRPSFVSQSVSFTPWQQATISIHCPVVFSIYALQKHINMPTASRETIPTISKDNQKSNRKDISGCSYSVLL